MKKLSSTLLLLTLLLGACSGGNVSAEPTATLFPTPTKVVAIAPATTTPKVTETTVPVRDAVVSEIKNDVSARALSTKDFAPASIGMSILPSGGVETGVDGRARLDLLSEGTIVRVVPNSSFTIPEITVDNGQPKTTIELLFGRIFILLNGGSLDVKTSMGVASVRGSLMRVEYDPEKKVFKASCLDGHCSLKNEDEDIVELVAGEYTYIEGDLPPIDPILIDRDEIQEWLDEVPELSDFLDKLPNPDDYPDYGGGNNNGYPNP